uniref:Uncharacterized protein n=1 Tax=Lepeophtheirus salmonis TaxID=72036 RepID=A0A0K2VLT8_LEPSM
MMTNVLYHTYISRPVFPNLLEITSTLQLFIFLLYFFARLILSLSWLVVCLWMFRRS